MGLDLTDHGLILQLMEGALWSILVLFVFFFLFLIQGYIQTYLHYRTDRRERIERSDEGRSDPGAAASNVSSAKAA